MAGAYKAAPDRIPTIQYGIFIPFLIGAWLIWRSPAVGRIIDAMPQPRIYRALGVIFLILYATDKMLPGDSTMICGVRVAIKGDSDVHTSANFDSRINGPCSRNVERYRRGATTIRNCGFSHHLRPMRPPKRFGSPSSLRHSVAHPGECASKCARIVKGAGKDDGNPECRQQSLAGFFA